MTEVSSGGPSAVGSVVGPGSVLLKLPETGQLRVGPGLQAHEGALVSTRGGVLRQTNKGMLWIEGRQKRYIPLVNDMVVGIIIERHTELSFEGATRRNRPNLKPGDVVYAKVVAADRDMDPILTCMDAQGRAAGMGHLKDGVVLQVSTALARRLLASPQCVLLEALGAVFKFELATGVNGRAWLNASTTQAVVLVGNVITQSEFLTDMQVRTLVGRVALQAQ